MNKKNVLLKISRCLIVVLMTIGTASTVKAQQGLLVRSYEGTVTPFSYSTVSKLTFQNEIMTLVSPAGVISQSFALGTTAGITFGNVAISALNETYMGESNIRLYPSIALNTINLEGASEGTQVAVFSVTGSKIMQFDVTSTLQSVNVSSFKSGIYFMRVNGHTFKFSKQ